MLLCSCHKSVSALVALAFPAATTTIVSLLLGCCPSAILRRVRAIVVDSVKAVIFGRTSAHVRKERLEIKPPFAHLYSSTAIVGVCVIVWVAAAILHCVPNGIFSRSNAAMSGLQHLTPTSLIGLFFQPVASAEEHKSTKALAFVNVLSTGINPYGANDFNPTKHEAAKVDMCWHGAIISSCGVIANHKRQA